MQTIDNIVFDDFVYPHARHLALLLYHMEGTHIAIPLPNAHLMSFIRVFRNTSDCQNHIVTNNEQDITLYVYEDNMGWLIMNSYLNNIPQLRRISIFCSTPEEQKYWATHTRRYRERIEEPFLYNGLDFELLYFGIRYIRQVLEQLPNNNAMRQSLQQNHRNMCQALQHYI
ncbi:unnamed protein product [Rotaria sp. Silwood2]|nr:unnamed protein product [Rotaria sp. Silwood2]CAF2878494.1 unnamed protein product [Rotaria sp. Silwood2]CAF3327906.1 unnamed protein product [Rotaria sp. Silwood2]CAF3857338.1 unnamed protein product [Rotaria sp. Silwood2]CAF4508531.1 unnamed protein product [Rotaria sp. Silwood2]